MFQSPSRARPLPVRCGTRLRISSAGACGTVDFFYKCPPGPGSLPTPRRLGGPRAREPESPRALRGADEGREPPNSVRAVVSTSGLRYVACTATQTSPDLPVCLRWLQEPSACTSSAQLLSRHLSHAPRAPQQSRTTSRARGPTSRRTRRPQAASASDALHGRCWWPRLRHVAARRPRDAFLKRRNTRKG